MMISPESAESELLSGAVPSFHPKVSLLKRFPTQACITSPPCLWHYIAWGNCVQGFTVLANCIPTSWRGVSRDKWRTGQVFISSGCFTWEDSDSCHALSCMQLGAQGGRGDRSPCAHTQALEVSICVHSTEQQAGINLARALISPVIRAINHSIQNMQEK